MLTGLFLTLGIHAAIHRLGYVRRQVDLLHTHIHQLHTQLCKGNLVELQRQIRHQLIAFTRHHFLDSAHGHLVTQAVVDTLGQQARGAGFLAIGGGVELGSIRHAELGVGIHNQGFLLLGEEALRLGVYGQYAAVELAHIVHKRNLHVQAGLNAGVYHLTKLQQHSALRFLDNVQGIGADKQHQYRD